MECECVGWARAEAVDLSLAHRHHSRCPKFATEKRPYNFYYDEGIGCWVPISCLIIEEIMSPETIGNGEEIEIRFKRMDMTDKEVSELPDV